MADFYKKHVDKFYYHQGHKYVHENVFKERVGNLLDSLESSQNRYIDAEKLLLKMLDNKLISLFFAKQIKKHLEKYRNHKLKF